MKATSATGLIMQHRLNFVATGLIVEPGLTAMPGPTEVAVRVTASLNTSNLLTETQNNLQIGQLVIWPKKSMAIFQRNPVFVNIHNQSGCKLKQEDSKITHGLNNNK